MTVVGPLNGIRVLALSRILAGPWAGQLLADYGAEVIKVERPGTGDDTRRWGPPFLENGDAAYFQCANRNKKSITVDFTQDAGADLIRQLAGQSHVVLENFKKDGLKKYGLDYEQLSDANPGLVYCSITGFGQTGPLSHRAGYDYLIQAMGGLMSITGQPDGTPGAEPMKVGVAVTDLFTGLYAVTGILAALREAEATGRGRHIDVSLHDCQLAMLANQASNYLASGTSPGRLGNAHPNIVPYQVFPTQDGHMVLAIGNDHQFKTFCDLVGHEALPADPAFTTNAARVKNRDRLTPILAEVMAQRTTDDWIELLETHHVPCGPINAVADALESEQAAARQMILDHGDGQRTVASPIRFSANLNDARPPPTLGADTDEVLQSVLGLSGAEIEDLRVKSVT